MQPEYTSHFKNNDKMKNFLALIPMGGQYTGKIGQHGVPEDRSDNKQTAREWADERFLNPAVIIELPEDVFSISSDEAQVIYKSILNNNMTR